MLNSLLRIPRRLIELGPLAALRRVVDQVAWKIRERRLGVTTAGSIPPHELGHGDHQYGYQPTDPRSLQLGLNAARASGDDVFLDIGCGLGRAVLIAADGPFRRVLGIEYSAELFQAAQRNLARAKDQLACRDTRIVHADATAYEIPDEVTVIFMFNPFGGEILHRVLDNIRRSLVRRPRDLSIIYSLPKQNDDPLERCEWLDGGQTLPTANEKWERLTIYRSRALQPAHSAHPSSSAAGCDTSTG